MLRFVLQLLRSRYFRLPTLFFILILLAIPQQTALAHVRVEIEPYVMIIGWEKEPVVVGDRNALLLEIFDGEDNPVENLESSLEISVLYAGRSFLGTLSPTAEPGIYRTEMIPTVRGQYEIHLTGRIQDLEIDEFVEPEEVLPARVLQFPEAQPDPSEMQSAIEDLEAQLRTANLIALVGAVLGLAGTGLAVFALVRGRKPV